MKKFYVKVSPNEKSLLRTPNQEGKLASISSDEVVAYFDREPPKDTAIPVELSHNDLDCKITGEAQLIDSFSMGEFPSLTAFKFKLNLVDQKIRQVWAKFFEKKLLELQAKDIMTPNVLTTHADTKASKVLAMMNKARVGSILITRDDKTLEGIFTERDHLTKNMTSGFDESAIRDLMTPNPTCIEEDMPVDQIYYKFQDVSFRHFPVVSNGKFVGILSIRDLIKYWTQLLEIQKSNLTEQYEKAMSVVIHDLRSPIYAVRSINELLLNKLESPQEYVDQEFPQMINESCGVMIRLIDDLLDISQVKMGALNLELEPVDLEEMVRKWVATFKPSADAKNITIELKLDSVPPLELDGMRFGQVFQNLLSNGIKYSEKNSQVEIELGLDGGEVVLTFVDHGQGIKEKELPKVFDELCKISSQPTANEPTTGLGLSITKRLIEAHGGSILATSVPNKETRFDVRLPLSVAREEAA